LEKQKWTNQNQPKLFLAKMGCRGADVFVDALHDFLRVEHMSIHKHSHKIKLIDDHVEPMSLSSSCDVTPKQAKSGRRNSASSHH
jgi:hypothetical protein